MCTKLIVKIKAFTVLNVIFITARGLIGQFINKYVFLRRYKLGIEPFALANAELR